MRAIERAVGQDLGNASMKSFKIREIVTVYLSLTFLLLAGCGMSETTPLSGRSVDRTLPSITSAEHSAPDQELQATFDKVSPVLFTVVEARNSLLRNGAFFSEDGEILRASATSYRQSLLLLRRKFTDLELAVGTESAKRLADYLIARGFVLAPEIMTDIESNSSMNFLPQQHESRG